MFEVRFDVREYEIDSQGVVNHAVYVNYLEHARSFFLKARGFEYTKLVERGLHLMVVHMSLDFKAPLKAGDQIVIRMQATRRRAQLHFHQEILRGSDSRLRATAATHIIAVENGRVTRGEFFAALGV